MKPHFALPDFTSFFMGFNFTMAIVHGFRGTPWVIIDVTALGLWSWLRFHRQATIHAIHKTQVGIAYLRGRAESITSPIDSEAVVEEILHKEEQS